MMPETKAVLEARACAEDKEAVSATEEAAEYEGGGYFEFAADSYAWAKECRARAADLRALLNATDDG